MRRSTTFFIGAFLAWCGTGAAQTTPYEFGFSAGLKPYRSTNSHPGWTRGERIKAPLYELRVRAGVVDERLWLGFNFGYQQFEKLSASSPDPRTNYWFSSRWHYSTGLTKGHLLLISPELCVQTNKKKITGGIGVGPTFHTFIAGKTIYDTQTYYRSQDSTGAFHTDSTAFSHYESRAKANTMIFTYEIALRGYLLYKPVPGFTFFLEARATVANFLSDRQYGAALSAGVFYTLNRRKVYAADTVK
jgi:hypothetical protein